MDFSVWLNFTNRDYVINALKNLLLESWITKEDKGKMKVVCDNLMDFIHGLNNPKLIDKVEKMVYRPVGEVYIPLPDSTHFHQEHPDFFGKDIGTFEAGSKKLRLSKEQRIFKLRFLASGDVIDAYINQEGGKAIQSVNKQDILGEWILREVFQLEEREILTGDKLIDLGINGIRLSKLKTGDIGLEFIWIDVGSPPADAIGWISKI